MSGGGGDGFFLAREEYEVSFYESFPTCVLYFILILFYFFFNGDQLMRSNSLFQDKEQSEEAQQAEISVEERSLTSCV